MADKPFSNIVPFVSTSRVHNYISHADTQAKGHCTACYLALGWPLSRYPSKTLPGEQMGLVQGPPTLGRPQHPSWPGNAWFICIWFQPKRNHRAGEPHGPMASLLFQQRHRVAVWHDHQVANYYWTPTVWRQEGIEPAPASKNFQSTGTGKILEEDFCNQSSHELTPPWLPEGSVSSLCLWQAPFLTQRRVGTAPSEFWDIPCFGLNFVPLKKDMLESSPPSTSEYDITWKQGHCGCHELN